MIKEAELIKAEDKEVFLKTLNKKGFLLEDKTWKILNGMSHKGIVRNKVLEHKGERVEIDFIFNTEKHIFLGECKNTDYTWIFAKATERSNTFNLIYDSNRGMKVKTNCTSAAKCAWTDMGVMLNKDGNLQKEKNGFAVTAKENRNDIHKFIRQTLKETEAYLSQNRCLEKIVMPTIVTNAKLYFLDYSKGDIDSNGNLTNYNEIKEVKGLVYNFPEVMRWDKGQQIIKSEDKGFGIHHVKSVFIININHLQDFINDIIQKIDFRI